MPELLIGYARVSPEEQDLTAQRDALENMRIRAKRIYVDHGLTGTNKNRPGLREAMAGCRAGDTFVVTKLDRLARSMRDAHSIADELVSREIRLSIGGPVHDPNGPRGKMLFTVLAMVAAFEGDLIRTRTGEEMKAAKAKGRLRVKQPKLSKIQEAHPVKLHGEGEHTMSELAELFSVGRSTVYRPLERAQQQDTKA